MISFNKSENAGMFCHGDHYLTTSLSNFLEHWSKLIQTIYLIKNNTYNPGLDSNVGGADALIEVKESHFLDTFCTKFEPG